MIEFVLLLATRGNMNGIPTFYLLFGNIYICVSLHLQYQQTNHHSDEYLLLGK